MCISAENKKMTVSAREKHLSAVKLLIQINQDPVKATFSQQMETN